jgi:hypothetical protein
MKRWDDMDVYPWPSLGPQKERARGTSLSTFNVFNTFSLCSPRCSLRPRAAVFSNSQLPSSLPPPLHVELNRLFKFTIGAETHPRPAGQPFGGGVWARRATVCPDILIEPQWLDFPSLGNQWSRMTADYSSVSPTISPEAATVLHTPSPVPAGIYQPPNDFTSQAPIDMGWTVEARRDSHFVNYGGQFPETAAPSHTHGWESYQNPVPASLNNVSQEFASHPSVSPYLISYPDSAISIHVEDSNLQGFYNAFQTETTLEQQCKPQSMEINWKPPIQGYVLESRQTKEEEIEPYQTQQQAIIVSKRNDIDSNIDDSVPRASKRPRAEPALSYDECLLDFDVTSGAVKPSRRRGKLEPEKRKAYNLQRNAKACHQCRFRKRSVSLNDNTNQDR